MGNAVSLLVEETTNAGGKQLVLENTKIKQKGLCENLNQLEKELPDIEIVVVEKCRLKAIPADAVLFKNVRSVDLRGNLLKKLPDSFGHLLELREVILRDNQLQDFPEIVLTTPKLALLDLEGNQLHNLDSPLWSKKSRLRKLILKRNSFTQFPLEVCAVAGLKVLNLEGNQLTAIPQESKWVPTSLREIYLGSNKLASFAPKILLKCRLRVIDLKKNLLTSVPDEISEFKHLRTLELQRNGLKAIPPAIFSLRLRVLKIGDNALTALPSDIGALITLEELYVQENQIESVDPEIGKLQRLKILCAEYNRIASLPNEMMLLVKLHTLRLHGNQFANIPISLNDLTFLSHLIHLSLDFNPLGESAQSQIKRLGALRYLRGTEGEFNRKNFDLVSEDKNSKRRSAATATTGVTQQSLRRIGSQDSASTVESASASASAYVPASPKLDIPPFEHWKFIWENMLYEEDPAPKRADSFAGMNHRQKWKVLHQYRSHSFMDLLREFDESTFSPPTSPSLSPMNKNRKARTSKKHARPPHPKEVVRQIQRSSFVNSDLEFVHEVLVGSSSWLCGFVEAKGVQAILECAIEPIRKKRKVSEDDVEVFSKAVAIFTTMIGAEPNSFLLTAGAVDLLVEAVLIQEPTIQLAAVEFLMVLSEGSVVAHAQVMEGFEHLQKIGHDQLTFSPLYGILESVTTPQLLKFRTLGLINSVINNVSSPIKRSQLRNNFLRMGFSQILQTFRTKYFNSREISHELDIFEHELADDYEELLFVLNGGDTSVMHVFEEISDIKRYMEEHDENAKAKLLKGDVGSDTEVESENETSPAFTRSNFPNGNVLRILVINQAGWMSTPFSDHTPVESVLAKINLQYKVEMPEYYGIFVNRAETLPKGEEDRLSHRLSPTRTSASSSSLNSLGLESARSFALDSVKSVPIARRISGDSGVAPRHISQGGKLSESSINLQGGFWLDNAREIGYYGLSGEVLCEYKMKPWSVKVQAQIGNITSVNNFQVDPNSTCDLIVKKMMKRFSDTEEEYGLIMEDSQDGDTSRKESDAVDVIRTSGGFWLKETKKLLEYGVQLKKREFVMTLKPKPKLLNISLFGNGTVQRIYFEGDDTIKKVKEDVAKQLFTSSTDLLDYGLFRESLNTAGDSPVLGSFLSETDSVRVCDINENTYLRLKLKPKGVTILTPGDSQGTSHHLDFNMLVIDVITDLCRKGNLEDPTEYCLFFIDNVKKHKPLQLNEHQTLQSQNIASGSTLLLAKKEAEQQPPEAETFNSEVNIWEEKGEKTELFEEGKLVGATLNKLVELVTSSDRFDNEMLSTFLVTYGMYTTPEMLFKKLLERYDVPSTVDEKIKKNDTFPRLHLL
eukprot:TRINITY_DN2970_c0_g1_i3.p1 TRINITY_DN2970_c0_g1~~TRINITY_DN2970_c0_g1_i3.p1  ORF type:complete len:1354 (-),score=429.64 TRINITY_DN2970_c0_g1_i3:1029-5090(-)